MKKIILIIFTLGFCLFSSFSETSFSLGCSISSSFESNGEYVYSLFGKGVVSYLEWQALPIYKLGVKSEIAVNNFVIKTHFNYGLPIKCGKMYDSDWGAFGVKNTYSISNNYSIQNYDFLFSFSYKIKLLKIYLIPEFTLDYYYDYFQSNDGEGWYGSENYSLTGEEVSWDSPNATHFTRLSRIDLKRNSLFVFLGLQCVIPLKNQFSIGIGTFIAPFSYVYNSDYHHDDNGTNRDFYLNSTQLIAFSRFKELLFVDFQPTKKICISISTSIIFGGIEKGLLEGSEQYAGTDVLKVNLQLCGIFKL